LNPLKAQNLQSASFDDSVSDTSRSEKIDSAVVDGTRATFAEPLFILAPPRSFTSIVCGMLGQHPEMYGLPELQLFGVETMSEWAAASLQASFPMRHGLLRSVAQLFFHEQTERTIPLAQGWIRRRSYMTTGMMFETIARKVFPRIPVEKSPAVAYRLEPMRRMLGMFPDARFLHLVRHPRGYCESVLKAIEACAQAGRVPEWLTYLASYPLNTADGQGEGASIPKGDPQPGWLALHRNICEFLKQVSHERQLRVRGEDLLNSPASNLRAIATWLGLRTDSEAIEQMLHPDHSSYACFGPPGARNGNDLYFLQNPKVRPDRAMPQSLQGSLPWRQDGRGFLAEVTQLAEQFGYQ
jgi:hypothetical protein